MDRFLTPAICTELSRLSRDATPVGATIGGITHERMAADFGEASAELEGDSSPEAQARHAEAMRYVISIAVRTGSLEKHLQALHRILLPDADLSKGALSAALKRLPGEGTHPFELSIALLAHLSLATIPRAGALARAACNIPLRTRVLAPMLFAGVAHHFPGLVEYAEHGDASRLVQAFRIAYGASCQRYQRYF